MELINEAEITAHLMQTSEEYRSLLEQHHQFDDRIAELEAKPFLTADEEMEEVRLKKLKLHTKDQMRELRSNLKEQSVQ